MAYIAVLFGPPVKLLHIAVNGITHKIGLDLSGPSTAVPVQNIGFDHPGQVLLNKDLLDAVLNILDMGTIIPFKQLFHFFGHPFGQKDVIDFLGLESLMDGRLDFRTVPFGDRAITLDNMLYICS